MPTIPVTTTTDGLIRVWWVAAIVNTSAPTVAELTAGIDLTCWLTPDGWQPSLNQAAVVDKRLCASQDFEAPGRFSRGLTVKYATAPQGTNTAKTTLIPGTAGYLVERRGISVDTAPIAAQKVNVYPGTPGQYEDLAPEENAKFKTQQKIFISSLVIIDAVVAA
jgi:hypothetical protein